MTDREAPKEKDVGQIIRYLTSTFNHATGRLERAFRSTTSGPNRLYKMQTEFAYLLNEVAQGPRCVLQRNITACNEYIDDISLILNREADNARYSQYVR